MLKQAISEPTLKPGFMKGTKTLINKSNESIGSFSEAGSETGSHIYNSILETDTESMEDEELEYLERKSFGTERDFFENFSYVTNIEDILENISMEAVERGAVLEELVKEHVKTSIPGIEAKDSVEAIDPVSEYYLEVDKQNEEEAVELLKDQEKTDMLDLKKDEDHISIDNNLEAFLEMQIKAAKTEIQDIDGEALARKEEFQNLQSQTTKFLNELINTVVQFSECQSPEHILHNNLDKRKLLIELSNKLNSLQSEQSQCTFLNQQVVRYFRRQNSFRLITEDNPKMLTPNKKKLAEAKEHLDQVLSKEAKMMKISQVLKNELSQQYEKLKIETDNQIQIFETKIRNCLYRNSVSETNKTVDRLLMKMRYYRQNISGVRLTLILRQHNEAQLGDMIKELDDLGNGLTMNKFIILQAGNQILNKKLEERSVDLNKLYIRSHNNLHILAHYKEQQQMLSHTVNVQRTILRDLINDKRILRERLLLMKLRRNKIHDQIKNLSIQSGLLYKPDLLYDFDQTVKMFEEKRQTVDYLKRNLWSIQQKINKNNIELRKSVIYT